MDIRHTELFFFPRKNLRNSILQDPNTCDCEPYFKTYKCSANFQMVLCLQEWPQGAEPYKATCLI
jgi:hypothetical protein